MRTLKKKDDCTRRLGEPKKVWFVMSFEEVVEPLRFDASKVKTFKETAKTIDFITMYPEFDQQLLKQRVNEAIEEAWHFQNTLPTEEKGINDELCISKEGWIYANKDDVNTFWSLPQVKEMVNWTIDNGFIEENGKIWKQVKGFGMGLQCAPQLANLCCYIPERDFSKNCLPHEVEHNYRFIDDILSLSGCIPTEEQYAMKYKTTGKGTDGKLVYLGMELEWKGEGEKRIFRTGMHWRDGLYPITIRRYPNKDTVVSDTQWLGVVMGQFIRALRICSTMGTFKIAIGEIVKACLKRGYPKRALENKFGRFLVEWWGAYEYRRGELRSWFRRLLQWATNCVKKEKVLAKEKQNQQNSEIGIPSDKKWEPENESYDMDLDVEILNDLRNFSFDDSNSPTPPVDHLSSASPECQECVNVPIIKKNIKLKTITITKKQKRSDCLFKIKKSRREKISDLRSIEFLDKEEWVRFETSKDGDCLFHSVRGENNSFESKCLRIQVADWLRTYKDLIWEGVPLKDLIEKPIEEYSKELENGLWGGEIEIRALSEILNKTIKVYNDGGDKWVFVYKYGTSKDIVNILKTEEGGGHYVRLKRVENFHNSISESQQQSELPPKQSEPEFLESHSEPVRKSQPYSGMGVGIDTTICNTFVESRYPQPYQCSN